MWWGFWNTNVNEVMARQEEILLAEEAELATTSTTAIARDKEARLQLEQIMILTSTGDNVTKFHGMFGVMSTPNSSLVT